MKQHTLSEKLINTVAHLYDGLVEVGDMPTLTVSAENLLTLMAVLRDDNALAFHQLTDLCGVDYLHYGVAQWRTREATGTGFSRAVDPSAQHSMTRWDNERFAVTYHLLSLQYNARLRVRVFLSEAGDLTVPSITDLWPAGSWFEREAYDLFGIIFKGHPDLRRLLTDYGFKGHPFRKDFPLNGEVELRYDAALGRCVYEPVSIEPKVTVPKVIRRDDRYKK